MDFPVFDERADVVYHKQHRRINLRFAWDRGWEDL
jgi:hypothetical protein